MKQLGVLVAILALGAAQKKGLPSLLDASLDELRAGLDSGAFSSVDLVKAYLVRIHETHDSLHAVVEINPDALSIAAERDAQRAAHLTTSNEIDGKVQSHTLNDSNTFDNSDSLKTLHPLHGIPILVKDNMATSDRLNTSAGSFALRGARPRTDATIITSLRRAGAIILGKTNMSQWASARSTSIPEGWSSVGGQTLGAYFPRQNPSGSSSGSAVAASVGLAWAALGSETTTSIIQPAHVNNCVGIKPTRGLTSRHLVVPFSPHQDSVGPIARSVRDAAYLLRAIAGRDTHDGYTAAIPWERVPDYVAACRADGLRGKRIGVVRNIHQLYYDDATQVSLAAFDAALDTLRGAGATVVDHLVFPGIPALNRDNSQFTILAADMFSSLPSLYTGHLAINPHNISSLNDLIAFTQTSPLEHYPAYDTQLFDMAQNMAINVSSSDFASVYQSALYNAGPLGLTGALANHSLDAFVMPSVYASLAASIIGTPVISVPLGKTPHDSPVVPFPDRSSDVTAPNQPFGIGFAGAAFTEESLIGMAYAFEQMTKVRASVKPIIQPKTELADILAQER